METTPFTNPACPHLPEIQQRLPIMHTRVHRAACGAAYFVACLELAQSLWRGGAPAQAILQLDKSMMAADESVLLEYPYQAMLWIISHTPESQFLGNPVRHFQHLASRMNKKLPNAEARVWRAWACLHLTEKHTPEAESKYPRDQRQLDNESLTIPTPALILTRLKQLGSAEEAQTVKDLLEFNDQRPQ